MPYMEIALGDVRRRNTFIAPDELPRYIEKAADKFELYRSVFYFGDELKAHLESHASVRGYDGPLVMPPTLIFDIDRKQNTLSTTREKAVAALLDLEKLFDAEDIVVHFSGRGFHLEVPSWYFGFPDGPELPEVVKATVEKHFPWADPSIFITTGLIRVDGTINTKAMLYKTRLSHQELKDCAEKDIEDLARTWVKSPRFVPLDIPVGKEPTLQHMIVLPKKSLAVGAKKKVDPKETTRIVTCMQKLWNEGGTEGSRHTKLPALASAWRYAGLPMTAVKQLGYAWAQTLEQKEVDRIIEATWGKTYSCEHAVMNEYCDDRCIYFRKKDLVAPIMNPAKMEQDYVNFIRSDFSATSINLHHIWPELPSHRILPGELVVIWGDTGVGKSTWLLNLAVLANKLSWLWDSNENHSTLHYRRAIQIANRLSEEQVDEHYRLHYNSLSSSILHMDALFTSPQLDHVAKIVALHNPRVFAVDVIDGILTPGHSDENHRAGVIATALKELAQSLGIIVFAVHHISKAAVMGMDGRRKRLTLHSGKGSSSVEQKADQVFAIEETSDPSLRSLTCLKARDQEKFEAFFRYESRTCRFVPSTNFHDSRAATAGSVLRSVPSERVSTPGKVFRRVTDPKDILHAISGGVS